MKVDKHFGRIEENDDKEALGRVHVRVDTLLDGQTLEGDESWISGSWPFAGLGEGFYFAPQIGALAEVEVDSDSSRSSAELNPRWTGFQYTDSDGIPEEFRSDPVNRGGIKVNGAILLFDRAKALLALISGKVRLGEEDASHPLVRGDTYNGELGTYLTAEDAYLTAEGTVAGNEAGFFAGLKSAIDVWAALAPPATPATYADLIAFANAVKPALDTLAAGSAAWTAAIGLFKTAVGVFKTARPTWLSTKCKTE